MHRAQQLAHKQHKPVLLEEAITGLAIKPAGCYVDATYGRGGHTAAVLERLGPEGRLLALDQDPDACAHAWKNFGNDPRFGIERCNFASLESVVHKRGLSGHVNGLLFDLGVSSPQLDTASRGFSFGRDGPLDMRMDPASGISVAQWLASATHGQIAHVLKQYGEERNAGRIAGAILSAREQTPITTTAQLARIVKAAVPTPIAAASRIHPATRSFQALRIFINDELECLRDTLTQSLNVLAPGGRLAVISFHSLEDRIVKRFMRDQARPESSPLPMVPPAQPTMTLVGKQHRASQAQIQANPRARSAVLRVAERTRVQP